jgi:5-hydroxyisourate hydrolase-like protein (transthyretin family)
LLWGNLVIRIDRSFAAFALVASFAAPAMAGAPQPLQPRHDTGQTLCYDLEGQEIGCSAPLFPFEDARFGRDSAAAAGVLPKIGGGTGGFDFTKIANDGSELPPDAVLGDGPGDWACTRDNITGLLWEIKRASGNRSYEWAYHWYDPNDETNGGFSGDPGGFEPVCGFTMQCDTFTYLEYVNSVALCGQTDWRLPDADELVNIVNYGSSFNGGGAMDRTYFNDEEGYSGFGGAWTGQTAHEPPDGQSVWIVNFDDGSASQQPKGIMLPVRAVSGTTPRSEGEPPMCGKRENRLIPASTAGAFSFGENGTTTDSRTGLTWMRCGIGQDFAGEGEEQPRCDGELQHMNWQEAMQEVRARNEQQWLGHDDWRLPNAKELRSIFEAQCFGPVVDLRVFPEAGNMYWSSTTYDWQPSMAWAYEMFGGNPSPTEKSDASPGIRLVRGGTEYDAYEGGLSHSIGGAVTGLVGSGLVLRLDVGNGGSETLTVDADGTFTFSSAMSPGDTYDVVVDEPPAPFQECSVENGSGTVGDDDVTNVEVTCDAPAPAVIEVAPAAFSFDVPPDASANDTLTIGNVGGGFLHWSIATAYSAALPAGALDCDAEPGLIVHDDGTVESAYGGNAAWPEGVMIVDEFTPEAYPASIGALCVALVGQGVTSLDFEIVVFDDNGPDGNPGTELGALAASATDLPQYPITAPEWRAYDLSSLYTTIDSGSLYVGIRFHPVTPGGVYLAADESDDRPVGYAGGRYWNWGDAGTWTNIEAHFPAYRSMFLRAVTAGAQEPPTGCDDPHSIPWLDVSPDSGSTAEGQTDDVTVSVNTSGVAAGDYSALLCLDSDDSAGNAHIEIPVSLHVAEPTPVLAVDPLSIDFGSVRVGESSASQTVTIENTGNAPLASIVPAEPSAPFARTGGSCSAAPFSLPAGQSCTIAYAFSPTTLGAQQQDLAIASAIGSAVVHLAGTGIAGAPATVAVVSGNAQSTVVATPFANPLVVAVRDAFGNPLSGVQVTFAAPSSGASATLSSTSVATDGGGTASVTATANGTAGSYAVSATVSGLAPASFALTNVPAAPAAVAIVSGNNQTAAAGTPFANALVVSVSDAFGNPVSGVQVTFAAPASGASATLSATSVVTNGGGAASVTATANGTAGSYAVTATVSGLAPASFALTNVAAAPATIAIVSGNDQSAAVGAPFANPLVVSVSDAFGNPVSGVEVRFAAPASGASATLSATSVVTDGSGTASVTATANGTAGSYVVTATVSGLAPVSFALTNVATDPTDRVFANGFELGEMSAQR